jgi:hypothetical protein
VRASSSVMTNILSWTAPILDRGAVSRLAWSNPLWWEAVVSRPSYPNWQRKRIQNPSSVSSNLTEGTHTAEALEQVDGVFIYADEPHYPLVPTFCPQFQITCRQLQ